MKPRISSCASLAEGRVGLVKCSVALLQHILERAGELEVRVEDKERNEFRRLFLSLFVLLPPASFRSTSRSR
jgi:hypothetical protein